MKLHHIGYAVSQIPYTLKRLLAEDCATYGLTITDPGLDVRVQFVKLTDSDVMIELVEPISENSPVHSFVSRGGGFYHLCFEVDDLKRQLELEQNRHATIVVAPTKAVAFNEDMVAFVLRRSGMLVEFIQANKRDSRKVYEMDPLQNE